MHPTVVVDIETSGLVLGRHEVIEVGYVLLDASAFTLAGPNPTGKKGVQRVSKTFSLHFNQDAADPEALAVNGWGKREFAPRMNRYLAAEQIATDFKDRLVVASPAHFDVPFLDLFLLGQGVKAPWSHRAVVDLKSYFLGLVDGDLRPIKNSEIAEHLQIPQPEHKHTALDDAEWAADMWMVMQS